MGRIKEIILNFDFGVHSKEKWIVFAVSLCYLAAGFILKPYGRLSWIFLLSSYIIGLLVYYETRKTAGRKFKDALAFLFPKNIWSHPSTINDCIVAILNSFLLNLGAAIFGITMVALSGYAGFVLGDVLSLEQNAGPAPFGVIFAYTIITMVTADFGWYWAHRWAHEWPLFWEFHKVHHSAEVMTPITTLRFHPLDELWNGLFVRIGPALAGGVFFYLYPSLTSAITIMSINIFIFFFEFFGANLRHSHIWLSFGPKIEHIIISPAMHQVHHSDDPKHFDKNFGSALSVWDWMFGTLYIPQGKEEISFGLGKDKQTEHFDTIPKLYIGPFLRAHDMIRAARKKKRDAAGAAQAQTEES